MNFEQETGWTLHPLNGETGQAYMGIKNEQKLFLKRNTSLLGGIIFRRNIS